MLLMSWCELLTDLPWLVEWMSPSTGYMSRNCDHRFIWREAIRHILPDEFNIRLQFHHHSFYISLFVFWIKLSSLCLHDKFQNLEDTTISTVNSTGNYQLNLKVRLSILSPPELFNFCMRIVKFLSEDNKCTWSFKLPKPYQIYCFRRKRKRNHFNALDTLNLPTINVDGLSNLLQLHDRQA